MSDTLSALDGSFLELEQLDEGSLMGIGGALVFDPLPDGRTPSLEALSAHLGERLASLPRFTERLSTTRAGGLAWPHWEPDERFDVRSHVRPSALPHPGGDPELCEFIAAFFSHRLDRTRPLWEAQLVEGLTHGRWAIALKVHHAMIDGVGLARAIGVLLDIAPDGTPALPAATVPAPPSAGDSRHRLPVPEPARQATRAWAHAALGGARAARHPLEALDRARELTVLAYEDLVGAPRTSLGVPIGAGRRYAIVRCPLAELRAIGHAFGGSVNDAALAACTGGLRRLLLSRGERPPRQGLRAMVPVNLRSGAGGEAGNRVSSLFVRLPVSETTAPARLRRLAATTRVMKGSRAAQAADSLVDLGGLSPPLLHRYLARSIAGPRLFNVTITNVPGSPVPLYALGAPLREMHPVVPLAPEHSVGIAIASYDGVVSFGILADAETTRDLDVLTYGVEAELEDLRGRLPAAERARVDAATDL